MLKNVGMYILVRRWTTLLVITAITIALITFVPRNIVPILPSPSTSSDSSRCPTSPPSPPYAPPTHDRFDWKSIPTKHPVQSFAKLPSGRPSALPKIQHDFPPPSKVAENLRQNRQATVKATFQRCWKAYRERAWMQDELAPVSGSSKNTFGGFAATLVDSLDTLWIMDMKEEFDEAVTAAMNISFSPENTAQETLNIFETNIRYLGGFIAAFDLTECKDTRLLNKAVEIGDLIYATFDTPNRMSVARWNPRKAVKGEEQDAASSGIIAELGSSSLEFTRLSQLTGDMRYFDAISRITDAMEEQQNRTKLPGMWPVGIDVQALDLTKDNTFSLGAMSDSAYEYLSKTYQLLGGVGRASQYRKLFEYAMDTVIQKLLFRPMVPDNADVLIPGVFHAEGAGRLETRSEHLACFVGGMFALGGRLMSNDTLVSVGGKVTDGCVWAYRNSPLGIMPEIFSMKACPSLDSCHFDPKSGGSPPGFASIGDTRYILRPEAIESVFYLYRITGDQKYQDVAWEMFTAIEQHTRTDLANAALTDMTRPGAPKEDSMESFWMAETLKYFYLVFSEPDFISLDDFVFNTEAHPFRLRK